MSPIFTAVMSHVEQSNLLALCTPILAYTGVTVDKDWPAFQKISYKGIVVSILVIVGTVLVSVVFSEATHQHAKSNIDEDYLYGNCSICTRSVEVLIRRKREIKYFKCCHYLINKARNC